jgi:hypothetical protein
MCSDVASASASAVEPEPYDHLRPTDPAYPDGVYRVVGVTPERLTLLRVAEDGWRVHTGAIVTVQRAGLDAFEPAANPDGRVPARRAARDAVRTGYWSVRAFLAQVRRRPAVSLVAVGLVAAGGVDPAVVPVPFEGVGEGLIVLAGAGVLAAVGSGRV